MSILPHLPKEVSMQISTIFLSVLLQYLDDKLVEGVRRGLKKTLDIFQHKYHTEDSKHTHSLDVKECCGKHLFYLSRQITFVDGEIIKAQVKGISIPKKPIQWVKDARTLEDRVINALKEEQSSDKSDEKHDLCGQILNSMKHCPVEGNCDEPITFVAGLHEKEDGNKCCSESVHIEESGGGLNESLEGASSSQVYDDDKIPEISERLEFEITKEDEEICESEIIEEYDQENSVKEIFRRSEKMPMPNESELDMSVQISENLRFEILSSSPSRETPNLSTGISESVEGGSSSQVYDKIPEISYEGSTPPKIQIEEIYEPELITKEDVAAPEISVTEISKRPEKMPIPGDLESSSDAHELEHPINHTGESDLDMSVQISAKLRFEILRSSPSREMPNLNVAISFGLDSERENYLFSSTEKSTSPERPEYVIVNTSGRSSKEMPTDDEWGQAGVVNLSEKSSLLLKEGLDCPILALLFLQRNNCLNHIPPSFFDRMPSLRFLDLSYTRISDLPASLFKLKELKVLLLRSCVCLETLPTKVGKLGNMQVLDLSNTDLYYLPKEIDQLKRLKHLHLSFYGSDHGSGYARLPSKILLPSIFSELKDLEELSIIVHPEDQRWIKIADEIINHVIRLEKLKHLQFYFPSVEALNSFVEMSPSWKNRRMRRFKFIVGHNVKRIISRVPDEVESKYDQLDRSLRFVNGSHEVPKEMKNLLISVKAFYLDHHLGIQALSEFGIVNFKELEFCVVRECPNFKVMMIGDKSSSASAFPNLEHLEMHYLWELERIWEDPVPLGSFKALTCLIVDTCPKLEYIASQSMLQCLSNLETFIIEDCESLKSIVKEKKRAKYSEATLLPRLTKLALRHLPQLATLGSGLRPSEEIIIRQFCPNLILSPHPERTKRRKFLGSSC